MNINNEIVEELHLPPRTSNKDMMLSNLKSAISADSALKAKAGKDREFIKYFEDADFKAAVQ